ncbi:carbohydrate ABC transporter permease [Arthrobacter sp. H5]|uniref:carbohydrate ABC transporter permease n=1 Tax=Arthrobacter sp. H5 TaxID=1267973 RepID=UPI0004B8253E|nr:carbohydrate ABC transporter permease [Arthrobacter sp. H5]
MATTTAPVKPGAKRPWWRSEAKESYKVNWSATIIMLVASLTILIPLYFTVVMALKTPEQTGIGTGLELPSPMRLQNFVDAWVTVGFGDALLSTAFITVISVAGALVSGSMVAYAIVRNWQHRLFKITYVYILAGLFIPFTVVILPLVKQTAVLGLDNPLGVAIVHIVGGISFNSLLFIAFIRSIPIELEESARMDGATTWQVFWRIIFPLLAPMNATVGIFAFLASWNDFLLPQLLIADPTLQTLPVVQSLFQGEFNTNYNLAFSSYLMALAPTLIVYIIAQRWVLSGVMRGSVKA